MEKLAMLAILIAGAAAAATAVLAEDRPAPERTPDDLWQQVRPGQTTADELKQLLGAPSRTYQLKIPKQGYDYRLDHPMASAYDPLAPKPDPSVPRVDAEVWAYPSDDPAVKGGPVYETRVVIRDGKVAYLRTWPRAYEATLPAAKARHGRHPFTKERQFFELDIYSTYDEYAWRALGVVLLAEAKGDEETRKFKIKLLVPPEVKGGGAKDDARQEPKDDATHE